MARPILSLTSSVALIIALMGAAHALTDASYQCDTDESCGEGELCVQNGFECAAADRVCVNSATCPADEYCNLSSSGCPREGDRCAAGPMGLCTAINPDGGCASDADCDDNQLCTLSRTALRTRCAENDMRCLEQRVPRCSSYVQICEDDAECAEEDACIQRRCVPRDQRAEAETIVIDEEKVDRLMMIMPDAPGREADAPDDGCHAAAGRRVDGLWGWMVLGAWGIRRRMTA